MLFLSSSENRAVLLNIKTKSIVRTYSASPTGKYGLAFSPSTKSVIAHQDKNCTAFFSCHTQQVQQRSFTQEQVQSCAVTSCGNFMIGGSESGNMSVWNLLTGQLIRNFKAHFRSILCICISADNLQVATASNDSTVKVWSLASLISLQTGVIQAITVFSRHTLAVLTCTFLNDSSFVITGSADRTCKIFHTISGQEHYSYTVGDSVTYVTCSGRAIAAGTSGGHIFFISQESQTCSVESSVVINCNAGDSPSQVVFISFYANDPSLVIVALESGSVRLFSSLNGSPRGELLSLRRKIFSGCYIAEHQHPSVRNSNLSKNPIDLSLGSYIISGEHHMISEPLDVKGNEIKNCLFTEINELHRLEDQLNSRLVSI